MSAHPQHLGYWGIPDWHCLLRVVPIDGGRLLRLDVCCTHAGAKTTVLGQDEDFLFPWTWPKDTLDAVRPLHVANALRSGRNSLVVNLAGKLVKDPLTHTSWREVL